MAITLKKATREDIETIWKMQVEAFTELLDKYQDFDMSPATESLEKIIAKFEQPWTTYYYIEKPKVIISASGMCDAGRIRHHLKHNLWREECTILFVGYQAMGTLGRRLIEGEKNVKLFGEPIEVKARIESLHGISGHADMNGLLKWLGAFKEAPQRVFVVHGEDTVTEEFAKTVEEKFGYQAYAPFPCSEADLLTNEILSEGVKIPVKAKKPAQRKADAAFERLVAAGRRLLDVIYKNEGLANKDKAKFESQINNLSDKWDI